VLLRATQEGVTEVFKKALEEKLAIIEKKDSNNKPTFYDPFGFLKRQDGL